MYSENDWWSYLQHSWGTKPEQKQAEKNYNHEYYEKNKERILAARKKHGDTDHKGEAFKTDDNLNEKMSSEVEELEELLKLNAEAGGYSDEMMENIRQHNQNIIDNIKALSEKVSGYMKDNPNMSEDQKKEMLASLREQIDKAKDMAIDLRKDSSKEYLSVASSSGGSSKKSSGGGSSSNSSGKTTAERNREIQAENAAKLREREASRNSSSSSSSSKSSDTPWYKQGDERYARALEEERQRNGSRGSNSNVPRARDKRVGRGNGVKIRK